MVSNNPESGLKVLLRVYNSVILPILCTLIFLWVFNFADLNMKECLDLRVAHKMESLVFSLEHCSNRARALVLESFSRLSFW